RPNVRYLDLVGMRNLDDQDFRPQQELHPLASEQVEIQVKYAGYIERQAKEVERHSHIEGLRLPPDLDYLSVPALSIEVSQKLDQQRTETLGQAARISGVTPAAISLLLVHLKKGGFKDFAHLSLTAAPAEQAQDG